MVLGSLIVAATSAIKSHRAKKMKDERRAANGT